MSIERIKTRLSKKNGREKIRAGFTEFRKGPDPSSSVPGATETWMNEQYIVFICPEPATAWGNVTRMMIRRNDATTNVSWCDKQRIKDALFGPERCAVEVFPPTSKLVNDKNIYHLWVLPEGFELPFGLCQKDGP